MKNRSDVGELYALSEWQLLNLIKKDEYRSLSLLFYTDMSHSTQNDTEFVHFLGHQIDICAIIEEILPSCQDKNLVEIIFCIFNDIAYNEEKEPLQWFAKLKLVKVI
jgi:hypothetical protein